jgi:hypothetical protein
MPWRRSTAPAELRARVPLGRGERILGWSVLPGDGWAVATGQALLVCADDVGTDDEPLRLPWHLVSSGTWADGFLDLVAATSADAAPERYRLDIDEHGLLAEAVRALVTDAIVWSGRVDDRPTAAATFSVRRTPDDELVWSVVFDQGFDATDPGLRRWADGHVRRLKEQTGL